MSYAPSAEIYDEYLTPRGEVRPAWAGLARALDSAGRGEMRARQEGARQLLKEHGVTYNVYADGRSDERPWKLDLLPLVLGAEEWAHLRRGLAQRAQLLDLVLRDLYGPQRLFHDGLLPPAILHANPGFLRPCHGLEPAGGRFLSLQAVDLTRAPDGGWWVFSDRTQAPSGIGYALENRSIVSRLWPDALRESRVQALAPFFAQLKAGLGALAPWTETPTIALLTPGPFTETYFEHAYLARHLGFALVEGGDLTVRQRRVYLKTLEGLQRVDVILRRVDDTFCDPLELRSDSFLGVPGLVDAVRARNVALSNALGSGAVEAPALLAFLPALAQRLLSEELIIPNVATWWCGQPREREHTLANLHRLVLKRAFVGSAAPPSFGETASASALQRVAREIHERPYDFVGQERVALSTAPVWQGGKLQPHPLILRCYICATPEGWHVLPGGITRVSGSPGSPVVTSRHGGGSKDTWVLAPDRLRAEPERPLEVERYQGRGTLPSRFAENLFWLGRYCERLEDHARLLRTVLGRIAGEGTESEDRELALLKRTLVELQKLPPGSARLSRVNLLTSLEELIFSTKIVGSAQELVDRIRFLTASLRDRLSGDTWRILNLLQTEFRAATKTGSAAEHLRTLHRLVFHLAAFNGMEMENMTRGLSWRFLELGRRLERAANLLETIRAMCVADAPGATLMAPLLEYSDSIMTYRRRHFARPHLRTTLQLLLADPTNPRSLAFQGAAIAAHLSHLPGFDEPELNIAELLDAPELSNPLAEEESLADLLAILANLAGELRALSNRLGERFFTHVQLRVN